MINELISIICWNFDTIDFLITRLFIVNYFIKIITRLASGTKPNLIEKRTKVFTPNIFAILREDPLIKTRDIYLDSSARLSLVRVDPLRLNLKYNNAVDLHLVFFLTMYLYLDFTIELYLYYYEERFVLFVINKLKNCWTDLKND